MTRQKNTYTQLYVPTNHDSLTFSSVQTHKAAMSLAKRKQRANFNFDCETSVCYVRLLIGAPPCTYTLF